MIEIPHVRHAAFSMNFQCNPSSGLQNIYESISEFKQAVRVYSKSNGP